MTTLSLFKTFDKENRKRDYSQCPSYTLCFGQLLSGNVRSGQLCTFEQSEEFSNKKREDDLINNDKVDEAMKHIRKNMRKIEKPNQYLIPSIPDCYNSIITHSNEKKSSRLLFEQPAHSMPSFLHRQNHFN